MIRPILLAIDCSGFDAQVVILQGFEVIAYSQAAREDRSAASLIPLINQTFKKANIAPNQTAAIAATYGPGSFTSLRIGLTTAKLLAYCWNIPTIPVNSLDIPLLAALRTQAFHDHSQTNRTSARVHVATNAYRQQFFRKSIRFTGQSSPSSWLRSRPCGDNDQPEAGFAHEFTSVGQQWEALKIDQILAQLGSYHSSNTFNFPELPQFDDAATQPNFMQRFELNETRIQSQESRLTAHIWETVQPTDVQDQLQWLQSLEGSLGNTPEGKPTEPVVLSIDPSLMEKIPKAAASPPIEGILDLTPANWRKAQALGWLAWLGLLNLDLEELSPFRLQPVYYRPSAAEENLAT